MEKAVRRMPRHVVVAPRCSATSDPRLSSSSHARSPEWCLSECRAICFTILVKAFERKFATVRFCFPKEIIGYIYNIAPRYYTLTFISRRSSVTFISCYVLTLPFCTVILKTIWKDWAFPHWKTRANRTVLETITIQVDSLSTLFSSVVQFRDH